MSHLRINFESTHEDYLLSKIFEKVIDFSTYYVAIEVNHNHFLELVRKRFPSLKTYEGTSAYYSKHTNNLEPYQDIVLISETTSPIAIKYSLVNINEDADTEKDFDYEKNGVFTASNFTFFYSQSEKKIVLELINELKLHLQQTEITNRFYTIGADNTGFKLVPEKIAPINELDIKLHYGKKFVPVLNGIIDDLKNKYHGLFLFYGEPGNGKTTVIRHLISLLCNDKTIIYVPTYLIEQLANPEFISFLQKAKESILILEDAEFALQSRTEEYGAQAVSNLLNITNGLLNDSTRIQVIATFNMDKKNIDKALLRPGRLLGEWKFDKLPIEESKLLATAIEKNMDITVPMSIAEIYNGKAISKKAKKRIGIKDDDSDDKSEDSKS